MEQGLEFFDAWAKAQKDFLENSRKSQEMFRSQWLESMKKTQEAFVNSVSSIDNPQIKEVLKLYNTWFNVVIFSSQLLNDEAMRMQKSLEKMLENQLEKNRELVKAFSDFVKKQTEKK